MLLAGTLPSLAHPPAFGAERRWRRSWFYLPNMVPMLPSFLEERSGGATPASWWLFPLVEEARGFLLSWRPLRP
jgi:hypothetical protein